MDILKTMYELKGCRMRFKTVDGDYEGILEFITPETKRITFDKVMYLTKNLRMYGIQHFFTHEIQSFSVISHPADSQNSINADSDQNHYSRFTGSNVEQYSLVNATDEDVMTESYAESVCCDDLEEEKYILNVPDELYRKLPTNYVVLDHIDHQYDDAIKEIGEEVNVGVSLHGSEISRKGKLSWLCISTQHNTFLFDIQTMKKEAFQNGLRSIFENSEIEKVFHDCRQASDCLYHQYETNIMNVFDTQVKDIFINMQTCNKGKDLKQARGVDQCLSAYLGISKHFLPIRSRHRLKGHDVMWNLRPATKEQLDIAIKSVIYLRLLRNVLLKLYMKQYHHAVDIYLNVLKTASEQELHLEPSDPSLIPEALLSEGIETVRLKSYNPVLIASNLFKHTSRNELKDQVVRQFEKNANISNMNMPYKQHNPRDIVKNDEIYDNDAERQQNGFASPELNKDFENEMHIVSSSSKSGCNQHDEDSISLPHKPSPIKWPVADKVFSKCVIAPAGMLLDHNNGRKWKPQTGGRVTSPKMK